MDEPPLPPGALADRVVVVAGGTGVVGGHVVRAALAAGARVVVPTRRPADAVGRGLPPDDARLLRVTVADWADPHELPAALAAQGWTADAAVASLGGWWIGTPLVELDPVVWRQVLDDNLTAHFLVARALVPLVAAAHGGADPAYVALNGAAAHEPMALSGPVSVAGAGQRMLLEVLRAEQRQGAAGAGVRVHEVDVLAAVAGDDRNLDPVAEVRGEAVAAAVVRVLTDPSAPDRTVVDPSGGPR